MYFVIKKKTRMSALNCKGSNKGMWPDYIILAFLNTVSDRSCEQTMDK